MTRGRFITVEGAEGVGKTTQLAYIMNWLEEREVPAIQTREPGGTELGEVLRDLVLDKTNELSHQTELLLIFAARSDHWQNKIKPALERGCWVLSDRFTDASYAYQGGGRGMKKEQIDQLEQLVLGSARPDLTLLLDMPTQSAANRVEKRGNKDRFEMEEIEFFARVRETYLTRAREFPQRIKVIQADQDIESVKADIVTALDAFWSDTR
ncbi:MAG: dTMP kinase [Pseudomonadota bacterium]